MAQIDHVVVLMLENRSFDHLLGYLDHPSPDFDGLVRGGPHQNRDLDGNWVGASPDAKPVLPIDPDHSHDAVMEQLGLAADPQAEPDNSGFVSAYERKGRNLAVARFGGLLGPVAEWWQERTQRKEPKIVGRGPVIMRCHHPRSVPVLSRLALDFAVCTRWFCSVPGETWPNRNFAHAATSDGEVDIDLRFYTNPTIFELLEEAGKSWRIYHDDTPQVWAFKNLWDDERRGNWFDFSHFLRHVEAGDLPTYSFIEPNHRPPFHLMDDDPDRAGDVSDNQHPGNNLVSNDRYDDWDSSAPVDFVRAEALIARVYEALRSNPALFERTLLLITYDEHGGTYDHVPPPRGAPDPGRRASKLTALTKWIFHRRSTHFDFSVLGPRVPAVVVSPHIEPGTVDTAVHEHSSIPATLRALFAPDAAPLTPRDAWAIPFHGVVSRAEPRRGDELPDLSSATAAERQSDERGIDYDRIKRWEDAMVPTYYEEFMGLSEQVRRRLRRMGVEAMSTAPRPDGPVRATHTTEVFLRSAHERRHRHD